MTTGAMGVLLGTDLGVQIQLRWALCLAEARQLDLQVYQRVEGKEEGLTEIPFDSSAPGSAAEIVDVLGQIAEASTAVRTGARDDPEEGGTNWDETHVVHVVLKQIQCADLGSLRKQLLSEIGKGKLKLFTLARNDMTPSDYDLVKERRLFLRYISCEVVFCFGLGEKADFSRVLVAPASGAHSDSAVRLGHDLATGEHGVLTAVRVNPSIGPDALMVGALRLDSRLKKSLGKDLEGVRRRIVVDDQVHHGLKTVWDEGQHDLIILGASHSGILGGQVGSGIPAKLYKGEPRPTVAVVCAESPIRNRAIGMIESAVERFVPQIEREHRVSLVDRIQSSSRWDFDFFVLMALSTTIAAIGLIQNSAAVVIGAMLVAPLMTPLLGLSLALVQGNPILARISTRAVFLGLCVALAVGVVVGFLTPGFDEPTREMLGRGGPGVLDLVIAFASGLAAAYASARPGLLAALPGVAIAAALVPPIATSGLALSLGHFDLALNALLLFLINMVTIILASMVSLWAVGLRYIKRVSPWTMVGAGIVLVSVMILGVSLSLKSSVNPATAGLPSDLPEAITKLLDKGHHLSSLAVAYDELGVQLNVRIVGDTLTPEDLAQEIRALVQDRFDKPVRVRLTTQISAGTVGADPGSID